MALRVLIIDEKAIRKGHGYMTLVLNGETGELLHMAEGKKKPSLESFFEKLTEAPKACIEAVCTDRSGAYQSVVGEQVPKATVVDDRFHMAVLDEDYRNLTSTVCACSSLPRIKIDEVSLSITFTFDSIPTQFVAKDGAMVTKRKNHHQRVERN